MLAVRRMEELLPLIAAPTVERQCKISVFLVLSESAPYRVPKRSFASMCICVCSVRKYSTSTLHAVSFPFLPAVCCCCVYTTLQARPEFANSAWHTMLCNLLLMPVCAFAFRWAGAFILPKWCAIAQHAVSVSRLVPKRNVLSNSCSGKSLIVLSRFTWISKTAGHFNFEQTIEFFTRVVPILNVYCSCGKCWKLEVSSKTIARNFHQLYVYIILFWVFGIKS